MAGERTKEDRMKGFWPPESIEAFQLNMRGEAYGAPIKFSTLLLDAREIIQQQQDEIERLKGQT